MQHKFDNRLQSKFTEDCILINLLGKSFRDGKKSFSYFCSKSG